MGTPEVPDLAGRIDRLGSTPLATGGYSSVWRGSLRSLTSDDPSRSLLVLLTIDGQYRTYALTDNGLGRYQSASILPS